METFSLLAEANQVGVEKEEMDFLLCVRIGETTKQDVKTEVVIGVFQRTAAIATCGDVL